MGRMRMIWDELIFKIRVSFDGLVIRKKVLFYSVRSIEIHLGLFVEIIEVQISVYFS